MDDVKQQVKEMISKAAKSDKSDDALKFSQAALNAANCIYALSGNLDKPQK